MPSLTSEDSTVYQGSTYTSIPDLEGEFNGNINSLTSSPTTVTPEPIINETEITEYD